MIKLKLLITFLFFSCNSIASEPIIIATMQPPASYMHSKISQIVDAISKKMDKEIILKYYSSHRATRLLNGNRIHAEILRIARYQYQAISSIRINEPIVTTPIYAYSYQKIDNINSWNSIKPYKIVAIRGFYYIEAFMHTHKVHLVNNAASAFKFLKAKRADILIDHIRSANAVLRSPQFDGEGIFRLEPPISSMNVYSYFSASYPQLAKQYEQAVIELKNEGVIQNILKLEAN